MFCSYLGAKTLHRVLNPARLQFPEFQQSTFAHRVNMIPPRVHTTGLSYQHPTLTAMLCMWMYVHNLVLIMHYHAYVLKYLHTYACITLFIHLPLNTITTCAYSTVCSCVYVRIVVLVCTHTMWCGMYMCALHFVTSLRSPYGSAVPHAGLPLVTPPQFVI